MLNKEQLIRAEKCIKQQSKHGCRKCKHFNEECPAFNNDLIETALSYRKIIKDLLEITNPMVQDWAVCPNCNGSWNNHKLDCRLKNATDKAIRILEGKY